MTKYYHGRKMLLYHVKLNSIISKYNDKINIIQYSNQQIIQHIDNLSVIIHYDFRSTQEKSTYIPMQLTTVQ